MILHPSKHLTSNYEKDTESNIYRLLDIGHSEHIELLRNLNETEAFRDMDNATGFTLDKIGKNVLELRNNRDDETFRRAIKIKIRSNLSAGTIDDINAIAEILFGDDFISVRETWNEEQYNFEPAALFLALKDNPDDQMMFFEYIRHLVMSVKAGGVRLYNRIYTDTAEKKVYMGSAVSSDTGRMSVRTRTLSDTAIPGVVSYVGVIESSDISGMHIPMKSISGDMIISSTFFSACAIYCDYSYGVIPTAEPRGG